MFIMQNNDTRLRRAARRTIRAEATLVLVIVIIISWSIYGLYKLSQSTSDSVFGLIISKNTDNSQAGGGGVNGIVVENEHSTAPNSIGPATSNNKKNFSPQTSQASLRLQAAEAADNKLINLPNESNNHHQLLTYTPAKTPADLNHSSLHNYLLQHLSATQRQDNELVVPFKSASAGPVSPLEERGGVDERRSQLSQEQILLDPMTITIASQLQKNNKITNFDDLSDFTKRLPSSYLERLKYHDRQKQLNDIAYSSNFPSLMQLSNRASAIGLAKKEPQTPPLENETKIDEYKQQQKQATTTTTTKKPPASETVSLNTILTGNEELADELDAETDKLEESNDRIPAESNQDSLTERVNKSDDIEDRESMSRTKKPAQITYEESDNEDQTGANDDGNEKIDSNTDIGSNDVGTKEQQEEDANSRGNDQQEEEESQTPTTTTTEKPSLANDNEDGNYMRTNEDNHGSDNNNNKEESSQDNNTEYPDKASDDEGSIRETSNSIDTEVDRMTQPSVGMTSREDKPFDYKSSVQFDESIDPHNHGEARSRLGPPQQHLSQNKHEHIKGDTPISFEDPQQTSNNRRPLGQRNISEHDLQVDHNKLVSKGSDVELNRNQELHKKRQRLRRKMSSNDFDNISRLEPDPHSISRNDPEEYNVETKKNLVGSGRRQKRSALEKEGSVDNFLPDFEILTSDSDPRRMSIHSHSLPLIGLLKDNAYPSESTQNASLPKKNILETHIPEPLEMSSSLMVNKNTRQSTSSRRRSDEETFNDTDERLGRKPPPKPEGVDLMADLDRTTPPPPLQPHQIPEHKDFDDGPEKITRTQTEGSGGSGSPSADSSRYHYLTSNDTGLQELLDKRGLLNALMHDKLPPPSERPPPIETTIERKSRNSSLTSNDHQTSPSLFTVDHGMLLYPSADEEHHHKEKSGSKKNKKHEKYKKKKKMAISIKKGGHKKKKHKKEMKKFLKEKKFKGAKKGKKVAKGKGGQGGKKGKKLYKDKGFKKKGFKNVYHKEEFGQKKSYFDEYRDKDFKKKWKKFDDKYNYAQMKKWQAKDVKAAKKKKDHGEKYKKYDKSKWKKKFEKHSKENMEKTHKKHKKSIGF